MQKPKCRREYIVTLLTCLICCRSLSVRPYVERPSSCFFSHGHDANVMKIIFEYIFRATLLHLLVALNHAEKRKALQTTATVRGFAR